MTIHEALPSSGRSRLLAAAALLAILALAAGGALLLRPLTAFAHHTEYSAKGTCAGWEAEAKYVGGSTKVLIVLEDVVVNGADYDSSWTTAKAFTEISSYGGGAIAGKPFQPGHAPTSGAHLWYWSGVDKGFTIFSRGGAWPAGTFSGRIQLYRDSGNDGDWDRWGSADEVTAPNAPSKCEFKVCKVVVPNGDGQTDGGEFPFEISFNDGPATSFTLKDTETSKKGCKTFQVEPGTTATVTELPARPPDWLGDESGYPKYKVQGGSEQTGSQATLQFSGSGSTIEVEFRNKEIKSRNLQVCKKVEDDGQPPSKEKWDFTFQLSWDGGSATVTVEDTEGGKRHCETVEVPKDADVTVTEDGRPAGWDGDAAGFPQYRVGDSGSFTPGSSAVVPSNKSIVTFKNKEATIATCADLGYELLVKFEWDGGWSPEGGDPMGITLTGDAGSGTWSSATWPITALIIKGGQNIVPHTDPPYIGADGLWGTYDNDGLVGPKGQLQDISNIQFCYAGKRTVRVIKVIEGTAFPQTPFSFSGDVGSQDWSVTFNTASDGASESTDLEAPTTELTVTEDGPGASWSLAGFDVLQGLQESCANPNYSGTSATIPAGSGDYTVCVKNTSQVLPTGDIVVHKYKGQPSDTSTPLSGWTISLSDPPGGSQQTDGDGKAVFAGLNPGTYTVCETLQTGWTNTGAAVNGQSVTPTANGNQRCVQVEIPQNGGEVTVDFWNDRSQTITFIKVECPSYAHVPRNGGSGPDHVGNPDDTNDLVTAADLGPQAPSGGNDVVTPAVIPNDCKRVEGWRFRTWRSNPNGNNPQLLGSYTTGADGSVVAHLSDAELDEIFGSDLWISEELRPGWGFGSLKCYKDHLNEDNSEFIKLTEPRDGVYCIAFNVRSGSIAGYKIHDLDGDGDWDQAEPGLQGWTITATRTDNGKSVSTTTGSDGSFEFSNLPAGEYEVCETLQTGWTQTAPGGDGCFTVQVGGGEPDPEELVFLNSNNGTLEICKEWRKNDDAVTEDPFAWAFDVDGDEKVDVSVEVGEGGEDCSTITLPAGTYTVTELDDRPSGYEDAGGFPKHRVGDSGSFTSGSSAEVTVQADGTTKVTFRNKAKNRTAKLMICKAVEDNGDGVEQSGTFSVSWESTSPPHSGGVGLEAVEGGAPSCKSRTVRAGYTYTVSEQLPDGWVSADGYPQVQVDGGTPQPGDSVQVGPFAEGQTIKVTFINKHEPAAGTLIVKKVVVNVEDDTTLFQVQVDPDAGPSGAIAESDGSGGSVDATFDTLDPGTHVVRETPAPGYRVLGWAIGAPDGCPDTIATSQALSLLSSGEGGDATVEVPAGGSVVLCFYNERFGAATVEKSNDTNGEASLGGSFTWTISVTVSGGPLGTDVVVSDTLPDGWSYDFGTVATQFDCSASDLPNRSLSCTLPAGTAEGQYSIEVQVSIPAGESQAVCGPHTNTVVLSEVGGPQLGSDEDTVSVPCVLGSGTIIIRKVVVNDAGDTTEFDATVTSVPGTHQFSQPTPAVVPGLDAGTYGVTELPEPGYTLLGHRVAAGDVACSGAPASGGATATVGISVEQNVWTVCFYNEKQPEVRGTIHVKKVVVDSLGGPVDDDTVFRTDIAGVVDNAPFAQGDPHTSTGLDFGTYTVHEDPKTGYSYLGYRVVDGNGSCRLQLVGLDPGDAEVTLSEGSPTKTVCFYNRASAPRTPTEPPKTRTPIIPKTPTPTPTEPPETPTPTETVTETPTEAPTETPTPTPTPVETVAGEQTPGPAATPAPPSAGTGLTGGGSSAVAAMLLLGFAAVSAGLALLVLGRRRA